MVELTVEEAREYLVGQCGLRAVVHLAGADGVRSLLRRRRCIQLDPLDRIGTNADLVAWARLDGVGKGDVYRHAMPGHGFEHFAKERCLLPASAFPAYRDQAAQTPWWRLSERMRRVPEGVMEAVLEQVAADGPMTAAALGDHGQVDPLDWHGWKSTSRAAKMALDVLWTRCQVVVCGRTASGAKLYDVPQRALPEAAQAAAPEDFFRWGTLERVEACGLLPDVTGPWWSMLKAARPRVDGWVAEGLVERVTVQGSRRSYFAPLGFRDRVFPDDDGRMRILGPLDPLLWSRPLVQHLFGFEYLWEVYKPAAKRRWGYYVCPLLHRGQLVGRFEGRVHGGEVVVERLWKEDGIVFDDAAFQAALARHARCALPTES